MKDRFGTAPKIKLGGDWVEGEIGARQLRTSVLQDLNGPGVCEVVFADPNRTLLDELGVDFGQDFEVHASAVEDRANRPVFIGKVYALEFQADETGSASIVRAYDSTYALRQVRAVASYSDVTDADLVRTLCGEAGVEVGSIDGGDTSHSYIAQLNETHWDFLRRRAQLSGCHLYAEAGKVHFEPIPDAAGAPAPGDHQSTDPLQLTPGLNLLYLRARLSSAQQVQEVEVRGWDPAAKQEVTARQRVSTNSVQASASPDQVAGEHGCELRVAGRPTLTLAPDCQAMATAFAEQVATAFAFLEGKAYGDPGLVAGKSVSIGRTGKLDGRYTLTSARHVFDQDGYFTYITVSGEHDRSLFGLAGQQSTGEPFPGLYPAIVTNIADPDQLGRVKVRFPWLADAFETNWCRVMQMGAGPERGLMLFPEVDDEVLVAFVAADVSHPVVIGGLYNGVDVPPADGYADAGDGTIDSRGIRTRIGHTIWLTDKAGEEQMVLETADQSVRVLLDQANGGNLVVEASGDISVTAGGNASLDAGGDVSVVAGGSAVVEAGADLAGTAGGSITLDAGAEVKISAAANLTLEAGGIVEIKGATINLN